MKLCMYVCMFWLPSAAASNSGSNNNIISRSASARLHCTEMYCTVLYRIVLYCDVLYYTVLYGVAACRLFRALVVQSRGMQFKLFVFVVCWKAQPVYMVCVHIK